MTPDLPSITPLDKTWEEEKEEEVGVNAKREKCKEKL